MKFSAILIVAMIAWRSSSAYDTDYQDTPTFFDFPPPFSSGPRYLSSFTRHIDDSYSDYPKPFSSDIDFSDRPSVRGERISFGSPAHRRFKSSYYPESQSYYKELPSSLSGVFSEYRGPPPPVPQTQQHFGGDGRAAELQAAISQQDDDQSFTHADFQTTSRQPLSFGGHANHLDFGDHALGFASVSGVTSEDLNPIALAEKINPTKSIPIPTPSEVQVSQQQPVTNPSPSSTEVPTSAQPTTAISSSESRPTATSTTREMKSSFPESTTPTTTKVTSIAAKSNLESTRNIPSQTTTTMMFRESPRTSFDFRTITQGLPAAAHGQLPIEAPRDHSQFIIQHQQQQQQQQQNSLLNEPKVTFSFQQPHYQLQQQHQQQQSNDNANNMNPIRFSIPTSSIVASDPKLIQGLDLSRLPLAALTGVSNSNTFTNGQNQIDTGTLNKLIAGNPVTPLQSYYFMQNNDLMAKAMAQTAPEIPLGSFYLIPNIQNYGQTAQTANTNSAPTGGQIQGSQQSSNTAFGGVEFLISSSNSPILMPENANGVKAGLNLQQQFQMPEQTYTKIGFSQASW